MKFHETLTQYAYLRSTGVKDDYKEFYVSAIGLAETHNWVMERNNLVAEFIWYQEKRPYYNIWPGIIPLLMSLKLDLDGELIKPLSNPIALQFPVSRNPLEFSYEGDAWPIKTILASPCHVQNKIGFSLFIDIGETGPAGVPIFSIRNFQTVKGQTVEESLLTLPMHASAAHGVQIPDDTMAQCVRVACGICLLNQGDSDLIQPSVLNKDAQKYASTKNQKYIDKAHRRGKVGWNIGKDIERAPHFRRAHLAIYWTGKGRTTPILKLRGADKPIIVHRDKVEKLPTDFADKPRK